MPTDAAMAGMDRVVACRNRTCTGQANQQWNLGRAVSSAKGSEFVADGTRRRPRTCTEQLKREQALGAPPSGFR